MLVGSDAPVLIDSDATPRVCNSSDKAMAAAARGMVDEEAQQWRYHLSAEALPR